MQEQMMVLVNEQDEAIGEMPKMKVHEQGVLHRAFSVFLFNDKGEMLLQKRALSKYHSPGLWTNAVCSHPSPEEQVKDAAIRRLYEELNLKIDITKAFEFTYKAKFANGLTEYEYDHVFIGKCNKVESINEEEVDSIAFCDWEDIELGISKNPTQYTEWFKIALPKLKNWMEHNNFTL